MVIDRALDPLIIKEYESIKTALVKIDKNQQQVILVVSEEGVLLGIATDGDIRRWLIKQPEVDLNKPIKSVMKVDFISVHEQTDTARVEQFFSNEIKFIPLLDDMGRLVGIARPSSDTFLMGNRKIGVGQPAFIIAEIGNNHNGSIELAKKLVDLAAEAGADCVKFQMRDLGSLYSNRGKAGDKREDLGSQYTLDLLNKFNLTPEQMFEVFDYCKSRNILAFCTPWDLQSLEHLKRYGMPGFKIASADLTNHELLTAAAKIGKPLICSSGMTTESEIRAAVKVLSGTGVPFALLHCNSTYPAPFSDINLRYMPMLKEIAHCPVGYSGHERGINVAVAAVALGANIIEKHFTIDRAMEGNDHRVSLLPDEFKKMVEGIREVELALGSGQKTVLSQGELMNREVLGKSVVVSRAVSKGTTFTPDMLDIKSPGKGLPAYRKGDVIGKIANRDFAPGDFIFPSDLSEGGTSETTFRFKRRWGIPVRYHDFKQMLTKANPELIEFHLSYKDIEEDAHQFFDKPLNMHYVVHAPELFAGDHILDLASSDESYRQASIANMQRIVDITRSLKTYFTTERPLIVANVGGFTADKNMPVAERAERYKRVAESLRKVDSAGVEIIPQTMPPFPWHFGGQRFHNLFVDPDEIVEFCKTYGYRVCLDIAHSKLACNHYKWSFREFVEKVGPYTAHYHISDALGADGEGLQIHDGEIDFKALSDIMNHVSPEASFIPEIWQGHKDSGSGFWTALSRLQKWF